VQEKAKLDVLLLIANLLPQHSWEKHEVIIVDPDNVVVLNIRGDCLCKQSVCFLVALPRRLIEGDLAGVVVE
jgi:hypothetical protein